MSVFSKIQLSVLSKNHVVNILFRKLLETKFIGNPTSYHIPHSSQPKSVYLVTVSGSSEIKRYNFLKLLKWPLPPNWWKIDLSNIRIRHFLPSSNSVLSEPRTDQSRLSPRQKPLKGWSVAQLRFLVPGSTRGPPPYGDSKAKLQRWRSAERSFLSTILNCKWELTRL